MADNIPDISPVVRRNAEWADRFGGASTNVAQRQRYAQDQAAMAQELLNARQTEQYRQAQTNKTAQDFYFRQQDMNRKEAMDKATLEIRHQQQDNKDSLVPAQIEATKARAAAQTALETARVNREARQAQNAARVATDTDSFEQKQNDLLDSAKPGSQAFADQTLKNISAHPFISPDLRKTWLGQAGIKNDPDQLMRDTAQFQDTHNTTLTRDSKGQWEVKLTPKPLPKAAGASQADTYEKFNKDLGAAYKTYGVEVDPTTGKPAKLDPTTGAPVGFPDFLQKYFETRGQGLEAPSRAAAGTPSPTDSGDEGIDAYTAGTIIGLQSTILPGTIPPPGTTVVPPAGPTSVPESESPTSHIPSDHAAYLIAHPDKAASFDQQYGEGSSAMILGQ